MLSDDDAKRNGYWPVKVLDTGEQAGVYDYLFTAGLVVGLDKHGWRTRFCYESRAEAELALAAWDGRGDPPGPWIKQKPEERHGPGLTAISAADETRLI